MSDIIKNKATPVMKQFWGIKERHPNAIILFRMGDFYETFESSSDYFTVEIDSENKKIVVATYAMASEGLDIKTLNTLISMY